MLPIGHSLYIGLDDLLGRGDLRKLRLDFAIDPAPSPPDRREVRWSILDAAGGSATDGTAGLARTGQVSFTGLPTVPRRSIDGRQSRWLRGSLATTIAPGDRAAAGRVRAAHLAAVGMITVSARLGGQDLPIDRAFRNTAPVDVTKDFLPFGERPRFGDALYLCAGDAFAAPGALVTARVTLSAVAAPNAAGRPELRWEYWDGGRWSAVTELDDGTVALTRSGAVEFRLGPHPAALAVNGVEGCWVRARIAAGSYGAEASYVPVGANDPAKGYRYVPPTLAPPSIAAISVDYESRLADRRPDRVLACNDFEYSERIGEEPFRPFRPAADAAPALYFGFDPPDGRGFPNHPVALYLGIDEPVRVTLPDAAFAAAPPRLAWECWTGEGGWREPGLRDDTDGLSHSGVIEFLAPGGFAARPELGNARYWLRCRGAEGGFAFGRLRRVLLNTVMAEHASTILDEVVGSSDGSPSQRFATAHRPVLDGQELQVREPDLPSAHERAVLDRAAGGAIIAPAQPGWARWQEVPDFYGSGPRDRHYVVDHLSGIIAFGDGVNGLAPPAGQGNLRLARYRTGGGGAGNCAAGTIVQLKTTVPYVDNVTNREPARGGADAETLDALLVRAPRAIRHGGRAVTIEDYEDLARLASPEVARAKCVPCRDLSADPVGAREAPGTVSVIVVPRAVEAKPVPSLVLVERVAACLTACRPPVVDLRVVGPDYVRVDIEAEIALNSIDGAAQVQPRIVAALRGFLHPLSGGFDGAGWDFGRRPHKSDLLRLTSAIPGVDHIRFLTVTEIPDRPGAGITARSLAYAGALDIAVTAADAGRWRGAR